MLHPTKLGTILICSHIHSFIVGRHWLGAGMVALWATALPQDQSCYLGNQTANRHRVLTMSQALPVYFCVKGIASPAQSQLRGGQWEPAWHASPEHLVQSAPNKRELLPFKSPQPQVLLLLVAPSLYTEKTRHLEVVTCPWPHSVQKAEPGFGPGQSASRACLINS